MNPIHPAVASAGFAGGLASSRLDHALSRIASIRSESPSRQADAEQGAAFASVLVREQQTSRIEAEQSTPWAAAPSAMSAPSRPMTGTSPNTGAGPWADAFGAAATRHGLPPGLLEAVASVESGFDPLAVSPAGAQGLMQFMPATAAGMGVDPFDPHSAIDGAARYLTQNRDRFGSIELALAAYNAGPGAVQRHGGIPPFAETQRYVAKVLEAWGAST